MTSPSRLRYGPSVLVGAALAMTGGVAATLLLYVGPGAVSALSVLITLILLSLVAGISRPLESDLLRARGLQRLRRRWLILFVSVVAAAIYAAAWDVFGAFGGSGVSQGVGMALLVVLPFYTGGLMLVGLEWSAPGSGGGMAALTGAAVGVFAMANIFFPAISPAAILLIALVFLSAGALLHGSILDEALISTPLAYHEGQRGDVSVERWSRGAPRLERLAFVEDTVLRTLVGENLQPVHPEEQLVDGGVESWVPELESALVLGGGGAGVAWRLAQKAGVRVQLVEPNPALLDALAEEMGSLGGRSPELLAAGWELALSEGPWDLIVSHRGGTVRPPPVRTLVDALAPGGAALILPFWLPDEEELLSVLGEEFQGFADRAHLYRIHRDHPGPEGVPPERWEMWTRSRPQGRALAVLAVGKGNTAPWPYQIRGFSSIPIPAEPLRSAEPRRSAEPLRSAEPFREEG